MNTKISSFVNTPIIGLMLRKSSIQRINIEELGYVHPNGIVNFQSPKIAYKYAENKILQALNSPTPFERCLVIKNSSVIKEIDGTENEITLAFNNLSDSDYIIHGHPSGAPLGISDLCALLINEIKSVIALNKKGEYSRFDLIPQEWFNYLPDKKIREQYYYFERLAIIDKAQKDYNVFMNKFYENIEKEKEKVVKEIQESINLLPYPTRIKVCDWLNKNMQNISSIDEIPQTIHLILKRLIDTNKKNINKCINKMHQFWENNAYKYNVKYSTNYSNLE